jgi:hypothetical protein
MRFILLSALVACSGSSVVVNNGTAAQKEKDTANGVKGYAKMTPPTNAMSMGPKTAPKAGSTTIPITNVDVYVFTANVDDDAGAETLYWARDSDAIYVWGDIDIDCIDDDGEATGETGVADFIYEADGEGYGWMVATDACGYSTFFGCSAEGGGAEVCGGCDFDESFVICAAD